MTSLAYNDETSFHLTADQNIELFRISSMMTEAKLPIEFVSDAITTALHYEGVADLVFLWAEEHDPKERNEIIADIQELVDDCKKTSIDGFNHIKFNDLDKVRDNIREFKDKLLMVVNENGGISKLATMTNIPQPSLSRFFNSNSMPRRQTLLKIAKALKLDGISLGTQWAR